MFQSLGKSDRVWLKDRKGHQISLETCFRRILCNKEYLLFVFCTHIHFASSIYFNCWISSITVATHFSGSMLNSGGVPPETYEKNVFGMSGSNFCVRRLWRHRTPSTFRVHAPLTWGHPKGEQSSRATWEWPYTTLHYTTTTQLHNYTPLHSTTLYYTTLYFTTLHYTTLRCTTLHYTTLHYTTFHYATLHSTTLHYTNYNYSYNYNYNYSTTFTLRYTTLH